MAFFESIWWLLVLIGVMIVVHELGHYWAARYFDVKVEAFSFGFGPRLFGWRRGETDWRVSAIPFGGYVKMYGEQPGEINSDPNATSDPRAFQSKPRWQRVIIAFAGPFMNILLAVVFVAGLYMFHFERDRAFEEPAKIGYVAPDSPAGKLGIAAGDQIVRIDDISYPNWEQVFLRTVAAPDREIPIVVDRNGEKRALTIIPRQDKRTSAGIAGWSPLSDVVIRRLETDLDAYRQGARPGDKVKKINGVVVTAPERVSELTRASNGGPVTLLLERNGKEFEITAKPEMRKTEDAPQGRAIIGLLPGPDIKVVQLPFG
ncbi:MAG: RIP metalloprotease RseP, partial [Bryobacteraceae bacterium]|nr:RIP metalloprotease RseP [Bryobacteraceae bacterium]